MYLQVGSFIRKIIGDTMRISFSLLTLLISLFFLVGCLEQRSAFIKPSSEQEAQQPLNPNPIVTTQLDPPKIEPAPSPPEKEPPQEPAPASPPEKEPPQEPAPASPSEKEPPPEPAPASPPEKEPPQEPAPASPPEKEPPPEPAPASPPEKEPPQELAPASPPEKESLLKNSHLKNLREKVLSLILIKLLQIMQQIKTPLSAYW